MSLQVNFTTHGQELRAAYEAVLKPSNPNSSDNNWALFGYDKGTNDLKVLGQGDGGLEELEEEFSDTKIQFAFVRVQDPYSKLNKFVFINWCGDGVPESKKGLFNTHVADVALFLKGYHLQINARCEADVTPAQIMKRLDEGSGSKYSTHQESYRVEKIQPLQSAYKKTEIPDIAAMQRNPTKPETAPQYSLGTKSFGSTSATSPTTSKVQDRWNPSAASTATTSPPSSASKPAEKSWKAVGGSSFAASSASFNKVTPPASLLSYGQQSASPNEPSMNKAQQIRLEREAREREERERIKREIAASEAREQQTTVQTTAQRLAEERRLQEQKEREREREQEATSGSRGLDRAREERAAREQEERERAEAENAARSAREAIKAREEEAAREKAAQAEEDVKRQREQQQRREKEEHAEAEASARRIQEQQQQQEEERRREQEQHEEEERYRKQQQEEDDKRRKQQQEEDDKRRKQQQQEEDDKRRKQQQEDEEKRRKQQQEEEEKRRNQQEEEEAHQRSLAASQPPEAHAHSAASGGVSAVVLYSYEKAEENEMSLIEGEVILNVTELDVGWWSGESKDGARSGLFPANYVEVIESEEQPANGAAAGYEEDYPEPATAGIATPAGAHDAAASSKPTAIALYDYAAGEPNEITFSEGETIVEIEFVTEDWWSGSSVDHTRTGLFPSNYVELHQ